MGEKNRTSPMPKLYLMFLFLWQTTFKVSDVGLSVLLKFLSMFLSLIATVLRLESLKAFATSLPTSVAGGKKVIGTNMDKFSKWVCCPSCHARYDLKDCLEKLPNGDVVSKKCQYVRFPRHPHKSRRKPCGTTLLKTMRTAHGSTSLYPRMLYCYKSLIESLQHLLMQPKFVSRCEEWRHRNEKEDTFSDVYDGQLWKDFLIYDGKPFLSVPFNFALSLNVDWFQPFKHTSYSVGAIYMAVQNLPRKVRFMPENIILVGIIPGPHEPSLTINTYLEPLVDELLKLWDGMVMASFMQPAVLVRAALLCVACDIPASRKVCGFVSHSATKGCNKCLKDFPTDSFGMPPDYGGFDRQKWPVRTNSAHRHHALKYRECNTVSAQNEVLKIHGCRYSILLKLPYFDPIRMSMIDPMHNLLLGTARHMFSIWKELGLITDSMLLDIQEKVNKFVTPGDAGRIPIKIASGFSGFTADQWKNWILVYSLFSLKEHLNYRHFQCWHLFVKACSILCRRSVKLDEVYSADRLLMEFCRNFEVLYGRQKCNINLHLHAHLSSTLFDHGPVYSFWLFSFERLNGTLGSFRTNCRDVSLQLMRKFLNVSQYYGIEFWPNEYCADFAPLLSNWQYSKGSLMAGLDPTSCESTCTPFPPVCESAFSMETKTKLKTALSTLIVSECHIDIISLYESCKALKVGDRVFGSKASRHRTSSVVLVRTFSSTDHQLAEVLYYFKFYANVDSSSDMETKTYWFAAVSLFQAHACKVWFGNPIEVWSPFTTAPDVHFIPLSFIKCRTAYIATTVNFGRCLGEQDVLVVAPLINDMC